MHSRALVLRRFGLPVMALALLSVACSGAPPTLTATAEGESVQLQLGTFCWFGRFGGECADWPFLTGRSTLAVSRGETVLLSGVSAGDIQRVGLAFAWVAREPRDLGFTWLEWPWPPEDERLDLDVVTSRDGLRFDADLPPGRYVVEIMIIFPQGDGTYGLLLDVR